jgi:hypothetical protein
MECEQSCTESSLQAVIIGDRIVEIRDLLDDSGRSSPGQVIPRRRGESRGSMEPVLRPLRRRLRRRLAFLSDLFRETAGDTHTTGLGSPIAKDVPVLRFDHAAPQNELHGVRQAPRVNAAEKVHSLMWSCFPAMVSSEQIAGS